MIDESTPEGIRVAAALIERFEKWILPCALDVKAKVDRGEKLNDFDIEFLDNVLKDAAEIKPHVDRGTQVSDPLHARNQLVRGEYEKSTGKRAGWERVRRDQLSSPA